MSRVQSSELLIRTCILTGTHQTIALVPVLMAALNAQPPPPSIDSSSLEHVLIGAAPLGDTVLSTFLKNVRSRAHPNMSVRQIYGLTETCEFSCLYAFANIKKISSICVSDASK
jgi:acyl-CoA synthetase (AMP-forming)/AMP-acid ligase II